MLSLLQPPVAATQIFVSLTNSNTETVGSDGWNGSHTYRHGGEPPSYLKSRSSCKRHSLLPPGGSIRLPSSSARSRHRASTVPGPLSCTMS